MRKFYTMADRLRKISEAVPGSVLTESDGHDEKDFRRSILAEKTEDKYPGLHKAVTGVITYLVDKKTEDPEFTVDKDTVKDIIGESGVMATTGVSESFVDALAEALAPTIRVAYRDAEKDPDLFARHHVASAFNRLVDRARLKFANVSRRDRNLYESAKDEISELATKAIDAARRENDKKYSTFKSSVIDRDDMESAIKSVNDRSEEDLALYEDAQESKCAVCGAVTNNSTGLCDDCMPQ